MKIIISQIFIQLYHIKQRNLIIFVELMERDPFFKKESVQELGEVVNYHTGISGMRIVAAMKKNPVLKKYAIQIPVGKKLNTYDVADILARQMRKFGFEKKEVKAIEDVISLLISLFDPSLYFFTIFLF